MMYASVHRSSVAVRDPKPDYSNARHCNVMRCDLCCWQGANSDELDIVENDQLEVVESEGDGWIRVCASYVR